MSAPESHSGRTLRVLCVVSAILGNKATAERLRGVLDALPGIKPTFVFLTGEDYATYKIPKWRRLSDPWVAYYLIRRRTENIDPGTIDLVLAGSWETAVALRQFATRCPAAVLMDSVPSTVNAQLRARGIGGWKRTVAHRVHDASFRKAAARFRYFLPMGSDCAEALARDYGVAPERCFTTLAPQDIEVWRPASEKSASSALRLLFVGNDFLRKGGEFLLRLYRERLMNTCTLTIASNDPVIGALSLPDGVRWLRGLTKNDLLSEYLRSDLFLFPTRQDYMPQVLAEALATGVPCLANDVGGIRDLVHDGKTGYLMSAQDGTERWAAKIDFLRSRPDELRSMAAAARGFAVARLSEERFRELIGDVLASMERERR